MNALLADINLTSEHMAWLGIVGTPVVAVVTWLGTKMWAAMQARVTQAEQDKAAAIAKVEAQLARAEQDKAEAVAKHEALAEAERKELKEKMKSFEGIGRDATAMLLDLANRKQKEAGLPPIVIAKDVLAERSSPVTEENQQTADIATQRATLVAVTEALGFPPREPGTPETKDERKDRRGAEQAVAAITAADEAIKSTLRKDIAVVKAVVDDVKKDTTALTDKIKENEQSPPGGAS